MNVEFEEYLETAEWDCRLEDDEGRPCLFRGSFVEAMWKWFEGYNVPIKMVGGKREPFKSAYKRVKKYYSIDWETRKKLRKELS